MNQVNLIGRVGGDIELRYTPSGKAVTEVSLAVDDGWGENKKTAWIGCTLWGSTAEVAAKYVNKGDRLGITGRLSQDEWADKETGKKQRKTKVTASDMYFLTDKRKDSPEPSQATAKRQETPTQAPAHADSQESDECDDIPF